MKRLFLRGGIGVALVVLPVSIALAAAPVKGALYMGSSGSHDLSFQVSAGGQQVEQVKDGGYIGPCLGGTNGSTFNGQHATIHGGSFTVKTASATLTGRFLAGGNAKGTIKGSNHCVFGGSKHYNVSWSATSEPLGKGSRYCPGVKRLPYLYIPSIEAKNATCADVRGALSAGTFTGSPAVFTSPGWSCTGDSNTVVECTKGSDFFSFTFTGSGL